jgi:hypothetical protein
LLLLFRSANVPAYPDNKMNGIVNR